MAQLIKSYAGKQAEVTKMDKIIRGYIQSCPEDDYNEILAKDRRWLVWLNLCNLRRGLVAWYPFLEGAEVLEIDGKFGALTGALCDQASNVTVTESSVFQAECIMIRHRNRKNLMIYAGEAHEIPFEKKFDVVIMAGTLEMVGNAEYNTDDYIAYLNIIRKQLLKKHGRLLLAVENRYGIKYFCGAVEPHTRRPFDGIRQYPSGSKDGYSFAHKELEHILQASGFSHQKFYYPMPDYLLPQIIYSDNYLPGMEISERMHPYYRYKGTVLADEQLLYKDILDNHVFPFMANSFLVECSESQSECGVDFAIISGNRVKQHNVITCIYGQDQVTKQSSFQSGDANIEQISKTLLRMKDNGLLVVPAKYQNRKLYMQFVKGQTLADYLMGFSQEDRGELLDIFDRFWLEILNSSQHSPANKNMLHHLMPTADWGPILKTASLEMVTMNCFYENHKFVFFDQEFIKHDCPAKYVMFRMIACAIAFQGVGGIVTPEQLRQRYGLVELWPIFEEYEGHFIRELHQMDLYDPFYKKMTQPVQNQNRNIGLLDAMKLY